MPKIIDAINRTYASSGTTVSLEFFPAKTEEGVSNLLSRIEVRGCTSFSVDAWLCRFAADNL
jgi:5,10-methylenetetrahydrofolate reductase